MKRDGVVSGTAEANRLFRATCDHIYKQFHRFGDSSAALQKGYEMLAQSGL